MWENVARLSHAVLSTSAEPRPGRNRLLSGVLVSAISAVTCLASSSLLAAEPVGLRVPKGFTVTEYAGNDLASDIFCMTIDSQGRVVVSGPGYVKILIDSDGDGRADQVKTFAQGPATGAQGMCFLGRDLLCIGDAGLIRYRDANGDDQADGPPDTFLKIKTGEEHNAHALRRGPDGWWYLISGNTTEINPGYATMPNTRVKHPHGGTILRLKPDLSGGEVFADGLRNAYDFDFDARGELHAHDSDGEPDMSLPWYFPTRLFHVLPGGEQGWVTDGWKRPDYMIDAAPVVASTGRGSPTGVTCYRHHHFPEPFRGGLFLLDWTFGRVWFVNPQRKGDTVVGTPHEFMATRGEFGFAPTDVEVGIDGSLFVCVGGRGTQGTVYRVTYTGTDSNPAPAPVPYPGIQPTASTEQKVQACLEMPQPFSSWARARWVPVASKIGSQAFLTAAMDERQPVPHRIRAIEILTDLFQGIPKPAAEILAQSSAPEVRARVVWSLGIKPNGTLDDQLLGIFLMDSDPLVRRRALETIGANKLPLTSILPAIAQCMNSEHRHVRIAAARLVPTMDVDDFKALSEHARRLSWKAAVTNAIGFVWRTQMQGQGFNSYGVDIGRRVLEGNYPAELKFEAVRLLQLSLGDLGSSERNPPAFDGYISPVNLKPHTKDLDPLRQTLAKVFPTGDRLMDIELGRLISMITSDHPDQLERILGKITPESHPVDDIHFLIVATRVPTSRSKSQQMAVAEALLALPKKLASRKLRMDSNWNERVGEIYSQLCNLDEGLPVAIIQHPQFGQPSHVIYMSRIPEQHYQTACAGFYRSALADPDYPWNNDVVFVLGYGRKPEYTRMVREQFEKYDLRMAVLMILSEMPQEEDRAKFVAGIDTAPPEVLNACINALERLPAQKEAEQICTLVKLFRRLGAEKSEYPLRERVAKLLERDTGLNFGFIYDLDGYIPQPDVAEKWTVHIHKTYKETADSILGSEEGDVASLKTRLAEIDWDAGHADRGQKLFQSRGCAQCHAGGSGLGPDLSGAAGRFSRDDLFISIIMPNRDVSPRYQTMLVETKAGKVYTGMIVYEDKEGTVLRNGTNQTFRINAKDIETKRNLPTSLMPTSLLKDLAPGDYADLYSYLKSLTPQTAAADGPAKKE